MLVSTHESSLGGFQLTSNHQNENVRENVHKERKMYQMTLAHNHVTWLVWLDSRGEKWNEILLHNIFLFYWLD